MNVMRLCELAALIVACRHEGNIAIGESTVRYCFSCGALRGVNGKWMPPSKVEALGVALVDDVPTVAQYTDPRRLPLPLALRRGRRAT